MDEKQIFSALAKNKCVSGYESGMCGCIEKLAAPYCDEEIYIDPMLNLFAFRKGRSNKKTILFSAHTDIGGFVVTHIGSDGRIYFSDISQNDPKDILGKTVAFSGGATGVIAKKDDDTLFVDIGAENEKKAKEAVSLFEPFTIDEKIKITKDGASGSGLDAYVGCTALCAAMKELERPKYDTLFVFASQNELSFRGATAAASLRPDLAVSVGTTDGKAGGGTYITVKDGGMIYQTDTVEYAMKMCGKYTLCAEDKKRHDSSVYRRGGAVCLRLGIGCEKDSVLFSDLGILARDICAIIEKGW